MRIIYGLGVRMMFAMMWLASFFHAKARKWIGGRKQAITDFDVPSDKKVVWFHCASLGEFDQGLPVMNELKAQHPDLFLLVTFFSPSGMEFYNKRQHTVDLAIYLPLDTKRKATQFVAHFKPQWVYFVKYEFWYNHLKAARRSGAKIYGVSSLFRPKHRFFKWYGGFFRKALALFDHFYTQDQRSADLLASIGINQTTVTGDTRYDRMMAVKQQGEANELIQAFVGNDNVLLLGSSWPIDEQLILPSIATSFPDWKIIIAPHDISETHIQGIQQLLQNKGLRYSKQETSGSHFLIVDTIGQLTAAYRYATVAYVGGGFTGKLHNILEPGAFGVPVIFGPKFDRFPEAQLFLDAGAACSVSTTADFEHALATSFEQRKHIQQVLKTLFEANSGAAKKVAEQTLNHLS